ncbi:4-hydroxythreonine-4-phosphate dehydrogenase PdxA [Limnohabitans parvus]|uniref:4-hydroxythreonine-4-phosphate dehydrogenase PdxA n=1 Tax=Limnohabitans parvus II-B4 TaxID=1293052 RepID=A0A315FG37_9BURK|nr:4-hydroxythreonine-4-phosphate dehydrogenase PdxA [Limnohabitans parvus]PUE52067.1 4-hydroxythreonine-4-phosphate dehydrogenase PdxA [Limnohabitans parvus II-B4]
MTSESALQTPLIRHPIAITPGDPCGIGPEIIARAWCLAPEVTQACFVAGDVGLMRRAMALVQAVPTFPVCEIQTPAEALSVPPRCLPVLQVVPVAPVLPWGQVDARAGQLAGDAVLWATRAALRGEVAALVTAPLHKEALHEAGAPYNQYPGHTELLQAEAARHAGVPVEQMPVRMMLANDELRTVLVSIHVSLRDALEAITVERVLQTLRITDASLAKILGHRPRMAVAGVNPHAGEGGLFGREEIEILQPCLALAMQEGLDVHGPYAPDTVFMRARKQADGRREFDVVIAMYHDQGLIPVKYLGVEQGVNVTLGLPLVRTSPDHGTAMDLAGKGLADARSMIEAIRMARQMVSGAH